MKGATKGIFLTSALAVAVVSVGCGRWMGNLRRDLDDSYSYDSPTVGGRWTERGYLNEAEGAYADDRYAAVGHSDRGPANTRLGGGGRGSPSWVSADRAEAARRARVRGSGDGGGEMGPTYANQPSVPPPVRKQYKSGGRASRADFIDGAPNEGSLWGSDGQTNYYFTKNKIRGIGDIISITVAQELVKDVLTEVQRTLSPKEREAELALAQARIRARVLGLEEPESIATKKDSVASSAAAPARTPASSGQKGKETVVFEDENVIPKATSTDIDVAKSLGFRTGEIIMAEIVERYSNGNYKIRGTKRIPYGSGFRNLSLVGVAKGTDITEEDTIDSSKLYEYRLEVLR